MTLYVKIVDGTISKNTDPVYNLPAVPRQGDHIRVGKAVRRVTRVVWLFLDNITVEIYLEQSVYGNPT